MHLSVPGVAPGRGTFPRRRETHDVETFRGKLPDVGTFVAEWDGVTVRRQAVRVTGGFVPASSALGY